MDFLANENFPLLSVRLLREAGHRVVSIIQEAPGSKDEDSLKTTFPVSTPFFHGVMDRFLEADGGIFKGPYISIKLPYRTSSIGPDFFTGIPLRFPPYLHQEMAFRRLSGEEPASAIIATGTGSGKTECFFYPTLDDCWRQGVLRLHP